MGKAAIKTLIMAAKLVHFPQKNKKNKKKEVKKMKKRPSES
jgi:hypothetical protein